MNNKQELKVPDFLSGGGEMGEHIRNFDWTKTPLGHPLQWEQSLRICVRIMLTSSQPIWIGWGKELIKLYNDPYRAIVGGKHPAALGQPASVVWKDIWLDIAPMLRQVMEKNEGTYVESQLLIMERYGYPEETYYTFSYSPVPGDDGLTAGMICYNTPDTEHIINQRSLQTLQELGTLTQNKNIDEVYQSAVKILERNNKDFPFAIISTINEGEQYAVPVAHAGIDKDHPQLPQYIDLKNPGEKGKYLLQAVTQNELVYFEDPGNWKNLPTGGWTIPPKSFVHVPVKSGNRKIPLAILTIALNPYRKFDGTYKNFIQLLADQVSLEVNTVLAYEEERKRVKALAEIDQAKTVFFSNISHEFRTPLTLMLGPLEEMMDHEQTHLSAAQKRNIETTHRNAMRLLRLVNTLLDFSRIEAGRQQAHFVVTDIVSFTQNLVANFRSLVEKAGLDLIVRVENDIPLVHLDKQMWEKIVFNLLSNAFKYTLQGSITVTLSLKEDFVMLTVQDTGVGIPESELPHIFERFHRVQNSSGRSFEGTGIGLSLIKELVQLHHGTISADSKPQAGATFTVKIPASKTTGEPPNPEMEEPDVDDIISNIYLGEANSLLPQSGNGSDATYTKSGEDDDRATVMIVDDNEDMREHIRSLLSKKFTTVSAVNGSDALQKMQTRKPDLVLSDIMMPVLDGIGLLKEIKNNPLTNQLPVILLTARAGEESKIEGFETGADDYLVKPFSSKELMSRVSSQIHTSKLRKAVQETLYNIVRHAPVAMTLYKGKDFIIDIINQRALEIWGKKEADVIKRPVFDVFPELLEQGFKQMADHVYTTGERFTISRQEVNIFRKGQPEIFFFNFTIEPIKSFTGEVEGILSVGIDVTAEIVSNSKIEASQRELQNLFKQAPVTIVVYKGHDYKVEVANSAALEMWGKTEEEVLGRPFFDISPELKAIQEPLLEKIMTTGEAFFGKEFPVSYYRKGELSSGYFNFVYQPARNFNNEITGIIAMGTEVTESVYARKKIEESERELKEMANAMPQLVWIADDSGKVFYYNDRITEFAGSKKMEDGGWKWDGMVHPDDVASTVEVWNRAIANGQPYEKEHRIQIKDGSYRWFLSRGYPQKDDEGKIIKWFGTATYIHDQKTFSETLEKKVKERTEELNNANELLAAKNLELEHQNEELASFTYVASHDLQEPLRKIQVFASRILEMEKEKFSGTVTDYFSRIRSAAFRMQNLIEALLNYSRTNSVEKKFIPTDLNLLLKDFENNFHDLIEEKKVQIRSTNLPVVPVIPHQFQQLLDNIISNSIKYCRLGIDPVITIDAQQAPAVDLEAFFTTGTDDYWKITIADNGIGFEQQYANKIFDLFQRLHSRTEYSGTGIGLAICKKIVQNHNGFITAKGEPGKGSTITIYIPAGK